MLSERLCEAFCQGLSVAKVPAGYAVSTAFRTPDGDTIGFYVVNAEHGRYRLEDDATTVPMLEALGIDLRTETRRNAFDAILAEYEGKFDREAQLLHSRPLAEDELPDAALRFAAMLLRLQDLELLTPRSVESTFREDALAAIHQRFDRRVHIAEDEPLTSVLPHYVPDAVFRDGRDDLAAVYIGTSQGKIDEAVMLHMELQLRRLTGGKVILLLETARPPVKEYVLARAMNHLDAVPVFRGSEQDALDKIERTVFGHVGLPH